VGESLKSERRSCARRSLEAHCSRRGRILLEIKTHVQLPKLATLSPNKVRNLIERLGMPGGGWFTQGCARALRRV